jgi:hypothetical protein
MELPVVAALPMMEVSDEEPAPAVEPTVEPATLAPASVGSQCLGVFELPLVAARPMVEVFDAEEEPAAEPAVEPAVPVAPVRPRRSEVLARRQGEAPVRIAVRRLRQQAFGESCKRRRCAEIPAEPVMAGAEEEDDDAYGWLRAQHQEAHDSWHRQRRAVISAILGQEEETWRSWEEQELRYGGVVFWARGYDRTQDERHLRNERGAEWWR